MSTLVVEGCHSSRRDFLATEVGSPVYQKYVELVKANIRDIYADRPARTRSRNSGPASAKR